MPEAIRVDCKAFRKNPDGSWTSVQVTDVYSGIGAIRICSDMTFKKGRTLCGIDIATVLDENCT